MNIKHYSALFCLAALVGCNNRPAFKNKNVEIQEDFLGSIFKTKTLQDSLSLFVSRIDSFPNPYGPTIYNICISKEQQDTIIDFIAYGQTVTPTLQKEKEFHPVGCLKVDDKIYSLSYFGVNGMEDIVNEKIFDLNYSTYRYSDKLNFVWDVTPSIRRYRLTGTDSLNLIYCIKSKYEE